MQPRVRRQVRRQTLAWQRFKKFGVIGKQSTTDWVLNMSVKMIVQGGGETEGQFLDKAVY